jgi:MFS transporter, FSR family, fosmidomycin resistance protein
MTTREASFARNPAYVAVSLTHFFVDVLNNSRTLLVALLAVSLGLTNAQVGIALLLYNVGAALSQPLFGWLADRFSPRWFVVGGMGWMIGLYGLAAVVPDWPALVAITLAGLGSGAFHPTGTKVASEASHSARTRATAVFFMAGQMGLFMGPILAGGVIDTFGRGGYLILPALALIALISGWLWVAPDTGQTAAITPIRRTAPAVKHRVDWPILIPLVAVIMTSSTIGIAAMNFAPKLFTEQGFSPGYVGWTAGLFMMGSAVGGLFGGTLGDRLGRKPPILMGMFGAILPLYFYIPAGDPWRFVLLLLAGFFAGMPHSVLVITAQSLLPGRRALASGLTLGLMFFSGAVGSYLVGIVADHVGLATTLQATIVLPITAIVASLFLPQQSSPSL